MVGNPAQRPWLSLYDEGLPGSLAPRHGTALEMFRDAAHRAGPAPLIHYFERTLTVSEVDAMSDAVAVGLAERNIRPGDRVALYLQNVPQFVIAALAIWKVGAIAVSCNPMLRSAELAKQLDDSGARAIVTLESLYREAGAAAIAQTAVELVITTSEHELRTEDVATLRAPAPPARGVVDFAALVQAHDGEVAPSARLGSDDVAVLTYTSGTTGPAKGAMNTHRNVVFTAHVYREWMRIDRDDVILGIAPLFHVTGLIAHLALGLLVPAPIILSHRFDAADTCRLVERHRATFAIAAITAFNALCNEPSRPSHDLSSLTKVYSGGAPIAPAFADHFEQTTGIVIRSAYGLTETTSPSHLTPLARRTPVDAETGAFAAGIPVFDTTTRIVDERGEELPAGEVGEVLIRGPQVVPGYWRQPEETEHALRGGELRTGDVGKMDTDGWLFIVDRRKDLIIASGYKVWPREVEDVLCSHPAVREAAVVGVPDSYRGESVSAFVSPMSGAAPTAEALIEYCRDRLAAYKRPKRVTILDELPKTASGKILRRELRTDARPTGAAAAGDAPEF
jgi:long-chain acyl-CoA synthetase